MRSVWLMDAALQFPGKCRWNLGKCRANFPRVLRLIESVGGAEHYPWTSSKRTIVV